MPDLYVPMPIRPPPRNRGRVLLRLSSLSSDATPDKTKSTPVTEADLVDDSITGAPRRTVVEL
jgi:hypothetical protein